MVAHKEFGQLSLPQLKKIGDSLAYARSQRAEAEQVLKSSSLARQEVFVFPFQWSWAYELSFNQLIAAFVKASGLDEEVRQCAAAFDPQQAAIDSVFKRPDDEWGDMPQEQQERMTMVALLTAMMRSLDSLTVYNKSLDELVSEVGRGSDEALFKAARVDRSVLSCPTVAHRLAVAELRDEAAFFRKLRNALSGPPRKPKEEYAVLRFLLFALEEAGALEGLTMERAYRLFCEELKVYPPDQEDPARSLWQLIRRWKKDRQST